MSSTLNSHTRQGTAALFTSAALLLLLAHSARSAGVTNVQYARFSAPGATGGSNFCVQEVTFTECVTGNVVIPTSISISTGGTMPVSGLGDGVWDCDATDASLAVTDAGHCVPSNAIITMNLGAEYSLCYGFIQLGSPKTSMDLKLYDHTNAGTARASMGAGGSATTRWANMDCVTYGNFCVLFAQSCVTSAPQPTTTTTAAPTTTTSAPTTTTSAPTTTTTAAATTTTSAPTTTTSAPTTTTTAAATTTTTAAPTTTTSLAPTTTTSAPTTTTAAATTTTSVPTTTTSAPTTTTTAAPTTTTTTSVPTTTTSAPTTTTAVPTTTTPAAPANSESSSLGVKVGVPVAGGVMLVGGSMFAAAMWLKQSAAAAAANAPMA